MRHIIKAKRRFGQNFLTDKLVISKIIQAIAPQPDQRMVEIGPGLGALTKQLLLALGRLDVIELDYSLIPKLQANCAGVGELVVHNQDVLTVDFADLGVAEDGKLRIVGNLPYNISTAVLFHLATYTYLIEDMFFMLQREIVDRIVAAAGSSNYGRLSVMVQYHFEVQRLFNVPNSAFYPKPKVVSTVMRLVPLPAQKLILANNYEHFSLLVRDAFNQRRKTLANSLKNHLSANDFKSLNIDPKSRAQQLTISEFVAISNRICGSKSQP